MQQNLSSPWQPRRATIVGVGLLGGSVGLALRRAWPTIEVIGYGRREDALQAAVEIGAIGRWDTDLETACTASDLVVVSTPVDQIARQVLMASRVCDSSALITDVGSTKGSIARTVANDPQAAALFCGSHPIAGSDRSGPQHATVDLFTSRTVVVTPVAQTPQCRIDQVQRLWETLGAEVVMTSPEQHDRLLAATSHLPHLIAAHLASILSAQQRPFVGSGWRDTTRIAAGAPAIWKTICLDNAEAIAATLRESIGGLTTLCQMIESKDAAGLENFLREAQKIRVSLDPPPAAPE